jgi:hypothetical protein
VSASSAVSVSSACLLADDEGVLEWDLRREDGLLPDRWADRGV